MTDAVHLVPWGPADHDLLAALNGDPAQMAHVGGAETAAKIAERQGRYERAVDGAPPAIHAFPGVENAPSNAVCRKAGFTLIEGELRFEYPPGTFMVGNDWRLALR